MPLCTELKARTAPAMERRSATRQPCSGEIPLWSLGSGYVESHRACVRDISQTGVGLELHYPFGPGAAVALELRCHPEGPSRLTTAHVVRLSRGPQSNWVLGCVFDHPLSDHDFGILQGVDDVEAGEPQHTR